MKNKAFWIQAAVWLVIFLMPAMFTDPGEELTLGRYLVKMTAPLCIFIAFYTTYLWLMPAYLKGKRTQFWVVSALLVLALSLGHHRFMSYLWHKDHDALELNEKREKVTAERARRNVAREKRREERKKRKAEREKWREERRKKRGERRLSARQKAQAPQSKAPIPSEGEGGGLFSFDVLIVAREIFNHSLVIGVAAAIVLSLRWSEAEKARRDAEAARTRAELDNLRSQVNPHFLLNTLNGIYALTAFDQQKAQTAIMELSKMMRHILYDNQQPYVNLADEVQFLQNYISLMRMRTGSHVSIDTRFDLPEPCSIAIAPMILISLVENAFKHGISPSEPSFIRVSVKADDAQIVCLVENSNHPKTSQDRSGHGIGLTQVARRLELSYKGRYDWTRGVKEDNTYSSQITIQL